LAALNALFTTWAMVRDARRSSAVMQALGARTGQISAGLVTAQVLSALPGAILGLPLGLGLFKVAVHGGMTAPATWLAACVVAVLAAVAALTAVPAAVSGRRPVAPVLAAETT
ncbi:MAG TPA: FtsX-like permease family protein, partial [Trebonia sp.]|nr:FtsX-like permease family protein [Trebonia sp.]